jgi:putative FmdB family regulatory protein
MPTYEYECSKCRKEFEIFQSMKDDSLATCPKNKCRQKTWGRGKVKRKLGVGAGFIFKGSGFYITDYRSEGYKSGAKNEAAKSESKPAAAAAESSSAKSDSAAKKSETPKANPKPPPKKDA